LIGHFFFLPVRGTGSTREEKRKEKKKGMKKEEERGVPNGGEKTLGMLVVKHRLSKK